MYGYYCIIVSVIILSISLFLNNYFKKKYQNQENYKNKLIVCTILAIVCAVLTPPLAQTMVHKLSFSVFNATVLSLIILIAFGLGVYYVINRYISKKAEGAEITENVENSESVEISDKKEEVTDLSLQSEIISSQINYDIIPQSENTQIDVTEDEVLATETSQDTEEMRTKAEVVYNPSYVAEGFKEDAVQMSDSPAPEPVGISVEADIPIASTQLSSEYELSKDEIYGHEQLGDGIFEHKQPENVELEYGQAENAEHESVESEFEQPEVEDLENEIPVYEQAEYEQPEKEIPEMNIIDLDISDTITLNETIDKAIDNKFVQNYAAAISFYEKALTFNPGTELYTLIVADLCSLYKMINRRDLAQDLLNKIDENLLNCEIKEIILQNL
ncbi:MAG: hypothetical protein GX957_15920 [Clostridiaceae bacterium]|nr:hypothetical protein [Clostridiaceae bacterium]